MANTNLISLLKLIVSTAFKTPAHFASFVSLVLSLLMFIISLILVLVTFRKTRIAPYLFKMMKGVLLMQIGFLIGIVSSFFEQVQTWEIITFYGVHVVYISYFFELFFFIIGLFEITINSLRVPIARRKLIVKSISFFFLPLSMLFLFVMYSSIFLKFNALTDFLIDLAVISGLYYMRSVFKKEMDKNSSQLIKLRLSIIKHSLTILLFYMSSLLTDAILRLISEITQRDLYFFIVLVKIPQSVFLFLAILDLYWVLEPPFWLRKRFNLEPERFKVFGEQLMKDEK